MWNPFAAAAPDAAPDAAPAVTPAAPPAADPAPSSWFTNPFGKKPPAVVPAVPAVKKGGCNDSRRKRTRKQKGKGKGKGKGKRGRKRNRRTYRQGG